MGDGEEELGLLGGLTPLPLGRERFVKEAWPFLFQQKDGKRGQHHFR